MLHVSTIYARFITRELQLDAQEIDKLLCRSSLDSTDLFEQTEMPYREFFDFLKRAKTFDKDQTLGLTVGHKLTPMSFGELGSGILAAPNLLESFILAANFGRINTAYFELMLSAKFNRLVLDYRELTDLGDTQQFQTEVLMSVVQNLIEAVIGRPFIDGKYYFPYQPPSNHELYAKYFNSPCYFNKKNASIEIPRHLLKVRSPFHDPVLWKSYQLKFVAKINHLAQATQKPFTKHVNDFLNAYPPPLPSVSEAANTLNMTERTLSRRLKSEGANYRDLRNSVLQQHALFYLQESDLSVDAIASQLGYNDFSSFRRAFKKWMGVSPQGFRSKELNTNRPIQSSHT